MKRAVPITTLFLDIGGVLLTDGWDHLARKRVAKHFKLPWAEIEGRHHLMFETYEEGKLTSEEYLNRLVFYEKRSFTRAQFRRFMFAQSKPYPEMIELVAQLKARHGLKIVVVSNEAREVNAYRIRKFKLAAISDAFISSCFVHIRKPDADIFRLALDIAQVPTERIVYIDNTRMFVQIAEGLGIRSILHTDYKSTRASWLLSDCGMTTESSMKPANPHILTINGGSLSIKFALFEAAESLRRILEGSIDRIGLPEATLRVKGLNQADDMSRTVSETCSDMHDLLKCETRGVRAAEAIALFCYQVKKWIGAFAAALGGLDTLVFAG